MKTTEQYFPVVLFIMLYKVVLTFKFVNYILKCDHSNESYWAVLSCGAVYYAVQGGSNFLVCGWNPKVWPFKWKLLSSTFLFYFDFFKTSKCVIVAFFYDTIELLLCNERIFSVGGKPVFLVFLFIGVAANKNSSQPPVKQVEKEKVRKTILPFSF